MPELPEVETIRRQLESIIGSRITSVEFSPSKIIRGAMSTLSNAKILSIERFGKLLVVHLSEERALTIHLKMTGRLSLLSEQDERPRYAHVWFLLHNGKTLFFSDMRKF